MAVQTTQPSSSVTLQVPCDGGINQAQGLFVFGMVTAQCYRAEVLLNEVQVETGDGISVLVPTLLASSGQNKKGGRPSS